MPKELARANPEMDHGSRRQSQRSPESPQGQAAGFDAPETANLVRSALNNPLQARPNDLLTLQRLAGNRATSQLFQTEETSNPPSDRLEREADRIADQASEPSASGVHAPMQVSHQKAGLQPDPAMTRKLASSRSGGQQLPDPLRHDMEKRLGADFSRVRVHTGPDAERLSDQFNADAFTYGHSIYMGQGQYRPDLPDGKHLLAHELAHAAQQNTGGGQPGTAVQRKFSLKKAFKKAASGVSQANHGLNVGLTKGISGIKTGLSAGNEGIKTGAEYINKGLDEGTAGLDRYTLGLAEKGLGSGWNAITPNSGPIANGMNKIGGGVSTGWNAMDSGTKKYLGDPTMGFMKGLFTETSRLPEKGGNMVAKPVNWLNKGTKKALKRFF